MRHFTGTENWFYVDDKDIAWLQSGVYPRHAKGTDVDLPISGNGAVRLAGPIAARRRANPRAVDPQAGLPRLLEQQGGAAAGARRRAVVLRPGPARAAARAPAAGSRMKQRQGSTSPTSDADHRPGGDHRPARHEVLRLDAARDRHAARRRRARGARRCSTPGAPRGSQRRDLDGDGVYEHSAGVALMDAWWPRLVRGDLPADARRATVVESIATRQRARRAAQRALLLRRLVGLRAEGPAQRARAARCAAASRGATAAAARGSAAARAARRCATRRRGRRGQGDDSEVGRDDLPEQTEPPTCDQIVPITAARSTRRRSRSTTAARSTRSVEVGGPRPERAYGSLTSAQTYR